jgi:hypothetical protein
MEEQDFGLERHLSRSIILALHYSIPLALTMATSVLTKFQAARDAISKNRGEGQFAFQNPSILITNRIQ